MYELVLVPMQNAKELIGNLPEDVVETNNDTTVGWVRSLNSVTWTSGGDDVDTETHEETTSHELTSLSSVDDSSLNDNTNADDQSTDEHTDSATEGVDSWTDEWDRGDGTDLGHGSDNASTNTDRANRHEVLEVSVVEQVTEEGGIETVGGGAAESDDGEGIQHEGCRCEWLWWFLQHCLSIVVVTNNKLGLDDVMLVDGAAFSLMDIVQVLLVVEVCHRIQIRERVCRWCWRSTEIVMLLRNGDGEKRKRCFEVRRRDLLIQNLSHRLHTVTEYGAPKQQYDRY